MSIKASSVRKLQEETGPEFVTTFRELLGIECDKNGNPTRRDKSKAQIDPEEFSIRDIHEHYLGQEFTASLSNPKTSQHSIKLLRESAAVSQVGPSAFLNINGYNQVNAGLLEAAFLDGYQGVSAIGDELVQDRDISTNGGKDIGIPGMVAPQDYTAPTEAYEEGGLTQRWIVRPPNVKYGKQLKLSKEAVRYDLTGDLLSSAERLGAVLRQGREAMIAITVMGQVMSKGETKLLPPGHDGNNYRYDVESTNSPNNTYQTSTSGLYNYINLDTSTELLDYTDVQDMENLFNAMTEPETDYPLDTGIESIIVSPNRRMTVNAIINSSQVLPVTGGGTANWPSMITTAANPLPNNIKVYSSKVWHRILRDAGFSAANATKLWFCGRFTKAFRFSNLWKMNVESVPIGGDDYASDVVNRWLGSWCGIAHVIDPRFVVASGANVNSPS